MKYQAGLEKTKKFLRESPEPEIRDICNKAGLTDKEQEIIVSKFRKSRPRLHASYDLGMSESRYSVKLTLALKIIKMEVLTDKTSDFVEMVKEKHPEAVEDFLKDLKKEFYFLSDEEAKKAVDNLRNESAEHPMGEKWDKATALKAFKDEGHSINTDKYSENGVYYAMNMVYSDYFPMYKDDVEKYVEHAYLFLNDKDYKGKYSKEKWYAVKRA